MVIVNKHYNIVDKLMDQHKIMYLTTFSFEMGFYNLVDMSCPEFFISIRLMLYIFVLSFSLSRSFADNLTLKNMYLVNKQ